jgi:hypothetical protein
MIVNTFRRIALAHELLPNAPGEGAAGTDASWARRKDDGAAPAPQPPDDARERDGQQRTPAEAEA